MSDKVVDALSQPTEKTLLRKAKQRYSTLQNTGAPRYSEISSVQPSWIAKIYERCAQSLRHESLQPSTKTQDTQLDDFKGSRDFLINNKSRDAGETDPVRHGVNSSGLYSQANWISKLTLWWMNSFFWKGWTGKLGQESFSGCASDESSEVLFAQLKNVMESDSKEDSLLRSLISIHKWTMFLAGLCSLVMDVVKMFPPFLISWLVLYLEGDPTITRRDAIMYTAAMLICALFYSIPYTVYRYLTCMVAMRTRSACSALIFDKSLKLSQKALATTSSGDMLNLLATDVEQFQMCAMFVCYLWIAPIISLILFTLLFYEFRLVFLVAFGVMLVLVVLEAVVGIKAGKMRLNVAAHADKRQSLMHDIITGIHMIKTYCWETPYSQKVAHIRRNEMKTVRTMGFVSTPLELILISGGKVASFVTIVVAVLLGYTWTLSQAFKFFAWMEMCRQTLFGDLLAGIYYTTEMYWSTQRIQDYLNKEEKTNHESPKNTKENLNGNVAIHLSNVSASWVTEDASDEFNINIKSLDIEKGKLVAIVGSVGSGKSTLLSVLNKELAVTTGEVLVKGGMALAPQEPWIFSDSLKENILVGKKPADKYMSVLDVCALQPDIAILPHQDYTLVGERGWSLSGGQRARVNLARAALMDREVYLLDDPLSAVDAKVAKHIFDSCIKGLLRDRTRILVTHQLQLLEECDEIIIMKEGEIIRKGSYASISECSELENIKRKLEDGAAVKTSQSSTKDHYIGVEESKVSPEMTPEDDSDVLDQTERRSISWSVWIQYILAGKGWILGPIYLILSVIFTGCFVLTDWWLLQWVANSQPTNSSVFNGTHTTYISDAEAGRSFDDLLVYVALGFGLIITTFIRSITFFVLTAEASKTLHNKMFYKILRSPMRFFERTPIGDILNRFSRDTGFMDQLLPRNLTQLLSFFFIIVGYVIFIAVAMPLVLMFCVPICFFVFGLRHFAMFTVRELKHKEASLRAPVYSHISNTVHGLQVVRTHDNQGHVMAHLHTVQNAHTSVWFLYFNCYRWLALRIEWSTVVFMACCFGTAFWLKESNAGIDGKSIGLSLTYINLILGLLQYLLTTSVETETQMTSVERILEYTKLEEEAETETPNDPAGDWPRNGVICARNMSLKYHGSQQCALSDITMETKSGEKIGIVGRTGAGKSSLFSGLLRLTEPSGTILIDDVDVTKIGLHALRKKLSVIPQDPILLTGTLRSNLDPWNTFSDDEIWPCLEKVHLKPKISGMSAGLDTAIAEGGTNFSVGQRQLLCLARALMQRKTILLIDEATANVDQRTDSLIQDTLKSTFQSCTIFTIAHRLHTVIEADRVMVLDQGRVAEMGAPYDLLHDREGHLSKLVDQTGQDNARQLRAVASRNFQAKSTSEDGDTDKIRLDTT